MEQISILSNSTFPKKAKAKSKYLSSYPEQIQTNRKHETQEQKIPVTPIKAQREKVATGPKSFNARK